MTIFAFLTLKTASSAHNKIFGAKFLSFERLRLICLYTMDYTYFGASRQSNEHIKQPLYVVIEPLYHSNTSTIPHP